MARVHGSEAAQLVAALRVIKTNGAATAYATSYATAYATPYDRSYCISYATAYAVSDTICYALCRLPWLSPRRQRASRAQAHAMRGTEPAVTCVQGTKACQSISRSRSFPR